ncbi:MAG: hypothetical protein AMXMBFR34_02530 [Myxococcaceae bacterium]
MAVLWVAAGVFVWATRARSISIRLRSDDDSGASFSAAVMGAPGLWVKREEARLCARRRARIKGPPRFGAAGR